MQRTHERSNVFVAALWMVVISIALFFLPLINGLIGGAVGGYKAGDWKRALVAAVIPAAIVTAGLWLLLIAFDAPVLGFVAGTAAGILILLADVGIFVGALVGGLLSQNRRYPLHA
jgi:hypothetical protein